MGIENVLEADGFGIAITGMAVVFTGLVLVSLYLTWLPRILDRLDPAARRQRAARATASGARADQPAADRPAGGGADPRLLAAITYVLQAERERALALDDQRITLRDDEEQRVWTAIGKMRTLATRL